MEPLAVDIERQGKQLSLSFDFSKLQTSDSRTAPTTTDPEQQNITQPEATTPQEHDVNATHNLQNNPIPAAHQHNLENVGVDYLDHHTSTVNEQPDHQKGASVDQQDSSIDLSVEQQLQLWDQGLPLAATSEGAAVQLRRSSSSEADSPPSTSTASPSGQAPGYDREPRPLNRRQAGNKVIITVEQQTDTRLATAAIRNTLTSRSRPQLEIFVEGDELLLATVRMLLAADEQLRRRGQRVVMQALWQDGANAKVEGKMRLFVAAVRGLEVTAAADLKVHRASNVDAMGQLLDMRLQEAQQQREGPPLVGVDVTGYKEGVGAAMRVLAEARLRGKSRKRPEDISVALEALSTQDGHTRNPGLRLVCMRCPKDSPQALSWYIAKDSSDQ